MKKYKKMYEKFVHKNVPNPFSLADVDKILKEKYRAYTVDKKYFKDLKRDPDANYRQIVGCYVIEEADVLNHIFSEEEKHQHLESIKDNEENPEDWSIYDKNEIQTVQMWTDIEEGRRLNIILESKDKRTISNFTLQGEARHIFRELVVWMGIDENEVDINNEDFQYYLECLDELGYLD